MMLVTIMTSGEAFIKDLKKRQLMVAVRTADPEDAYRAATACVDGGIRFVEITFSVPGAEEVIQRLCKDERVAVGAGTVLSVGDARRALKAGASYIVSPHFDEDVVTYTKKEGIPAIPGAATPTEIYRAHSAGADIIKLFPFVELGGLGVSSGRETGEAGETALAKPSIQAPVVRVKGVAYKGAIEVA